MGTVAGNSHHLTRRDPPRLSFAPWASLFDQPLAAHSPLYTPRVLDHFWV